MIASRHVYKSEPLHIAWPGTKDRAVKCQNQPLFGKVEFVKALISYEGESAADIKKAFEEAIDDYLVMCEQEKITPEKPFKGTFNVRIGEALHERAVIAATGRGIKLNEFVKQALEHELRT